MAAAFERHTGSDGIVYESFYFLVRMIEPISPQHKTKTSLRTTLSEEAKRLRWVTLEHCQRLVSRSHSLTNIWTTIQETVLP